LKFNKEINMRIAIVNDLTLAVEALKRVITTVPGYKIAWAAYNGTEAVEKCKNDKPDLILMDLIMPVMDGVEATKFIMRDCPCAILVITATVEGNASKVFEAMGFGALDAVCTPTLSSVGAVNGGDELLKKIFTISKLIGTETLQIETISNVVKDVPISLPPLIAIGSSTGGPKALSEIFTSLPGKIGAAIVVVQHVDDSFAPELANWLDGQTKLKVILAREGMYPEKNVVFIAATNDHLVIGSDFAFHYSVEPKNYPYRPSVDRFFESLVKYWPRKDIAIVLTGMGRDGAKGLLALRNIGWHTIAQDEKSSVIYGMPKAAAELNAASVITSIDKIPQAILKNLKNK
jgi:two-component system, chemotaxis family, response regulator WspF